MAGRRVPRPLKSWTGPHDGPSRLERESFPGQILLDLLHDGFKRRDLQDVHFHHEILEMLQADRLDPTLGDRSPRAAPKDGLTVILLDRSPRHLLHERVHEVDHFVDVPHPYLASAADELPHLLELRPIRKRRKIEVSD